MSEYEAPYVTPDTVEDAYAAGHRQGINGAKAMTRGEFLTTATEHQFPQSLWRAYQHGYRNGRRVWRRRQG